MSIDAKLTDLHRQVKIINKGNNSDTLVNELQILIDDFNPLVDRLTETKKRAVLLMNEGVDITIENELQDKIFKSNSTIKSILTKFTRDLDPTTIKRNCKNFTDGFGNTIDRLDNSLLDSWKAFLTNGKIFKDPADFTVNLAQNSENKKNLTDYRPKFENYNLAKSKVPETSKELHEVRSLAESLNEIYTRFKFDNIPDSVRIFLEKVSEQEGARLDLLTDEVLDYLKRTNTILNYAVRKGFFY